MVADVWKKDVWEFQAKSGSSGSCCLLLHFLGKTAVQEMSGKAPGSPRHPSSRHPRPSDKRPPSTTTIMNSTSRCSFRFRRLFVTCVVFARYLWAIFRKPQPLQPVRKVRQYTSHLYGSMPPICIAVLSWLLSFEERETLQYASHLYGSTPPICTAVRPPFVRQYFWQNTGGWGHRNVSEFVH